MPKFCPLVLITLVLAVKGILGAAPILAAYACVLAAAALVSAIVIARRIFEFAPASFRRRRINSLREIPAAVAFAVALAIADTALTIATRVYGSGWTESDEHDGYTTSVDASWPDPVVVAGAFDQPRQYGELPDWRLPGEHFLSDDQHLQSTLYGRMQPDIDAESEMGSN
ncbi:MAG: hypothetical protein ACJ789_16045 [Thermomicrobiales bacterium]